MKKNEYIVPQTEWMESNVATLFAASDDTTTIEPGTGEGDHDAGVRGWFGQDEDGEEEDLW